MIGVTTSPLPSPSASGLPSFLDSAGGTGVPEGATTDVPDTVIVAVTLVAVLVLLWFLVKARSERGSGWATTLYRRLDPSVQALRVWLARSPVTFVYIACWTVTSVIVQGTPAGLADVFARFNSTNILGIATDPLRVLFASAFLVADNGFAYIFYVVAYVLIISRLEQRIGSARIVIVGAASHALGSLTIVGIESIAVKTGLLAKSTLVTTDVGISYVMVGCLAGYLLFVGRRWRWWYVAALGIGIVGPLILSHTIWDLGHFLASCIGLGTTALVRRYGVRPPLRWRELTAVPPRPLPTWSAATP